MSDDDPWMKQLGATARDQRVTPDDAPAELLRPLSAAELDAIAAGAAAELAPRAPSTAPPDGAAAVAPDGAARVVPLRPARPRWAAPALVAAALSVAAGALLVARAQEGDEPLAAYDLVVEGGARATRSTEPAAGPVRIAQGGRLSIVLRPKAPVSRPVDARAFVEHGGAIDPWAVRPVISGEGVVKIDADEAAIAALPRGAARIVVFVASPSRVPGDADAARRAQTSPEPAVRSVAFDAEIR